MVGSRLVRGPEIVSCSEDPEVAIGLFSSSREAEADSELVLAPPLGSLSVMVLSTRIFLDVWGHGCKDWSVVVGLYCFSLEESVILRLLPDDGFVVFLTDKMLRKRNTEHSCTSCRFYVASTEFVSELRRLGELEC